MKFALLALMALVLTGTTGYAAPVKLTIEYSSANNGNWFLVNGTDFGTANYSRVIRGSANVSKKLGDLMLLPGLVDGKQYECTGSAFFAYNSGDGAIATVSRIGMCTPLN